MTNSDVQNIIILRFVVVVFLSWKLFRRFSTIISSIFLHLMNLEKMISCVLSFLNMYWIMDCKLIISLSKFVDHTPYRWFVVSIGFQILYQMFETSLFWKHFCFFFLSYIWSEVFPQQTDQYVWYICVTRLHCITLRS